MKISPQTFRRCQTNIQNTHFNTLDHL